MTLTYHGNSKDEYGHTFERCAILTNEENEQERELSSKIINCMEKVTNWTADGFDDMHIIGVYDKEDFDELMRWYKEARKTFTLCMKYGF